VIFFAGGAVALPAASRWELVPDSEGKLHLVDMNPIEIEPEPFFNPATDVFFVLFTRRNPTAGQRIAQTVAAISGSNWNSGSAGTRFIIHGWNNNSNSPVNVAITRAFLAAADHNVVRVDWGVGANQSYGAASGSVGAVGARIAQYIDFLHQNGFLVNFNRLIIAGHSLGAHIAGITGKRVGRGRVRAIFGLDPAGPGFTVANAGGRFAAGDGEYTEMIATNAGTLGFSQPIGTASFYPNWGSSQPNCGLDLGGGCSHGRVIDLFVESVTSARFVGRRCANHGQITSRNCPTGQGTGVMGGNAHKTLSGVFFVETNGSSPFARG